MAKGSGGKTKRVAYYEERVPGFDPGYDPMPERRPLMGETLWDRYQIYLALTDEEFPKSFDEWLDS